MNGSYEEDKVWRGNEGMDHDTIVFTFVHTQMCIVT